MSEVLKVLIGNGPRIDAGVEKPIFDGCFKEVVVEGNLSHAGIIEGGMASGMPSLAFVITMKHGGGEVPILGQMTYNNFQALAAAVNGVVARKFSQRNN